MANYAKKEDIADRLLRRKPHWFHGSPKIYLGGKENTFGVLVFDFGDEIVDFKIYIKDREKILDEAHLAVDNFNKIIGGLHEQ